MSATESSPSPKIKASVISSGQEIFTLDKLRLSWSETRVKGADQTVVYFSPQSDVAGALARLRLPRELLCSPSNVRSVSAPVSMAMATWKRSVSADGTVRPCSALCSHAVRTASRQSNSASRPVAEADFLFEQADQRGDLPPMITPARSSWRGELKTSTR